MRPARVPEPSALALLVERLGDARRAREAYLEAARAGALDVYGRRELMSPTRELIPREDWYRCEWYDLPDPLSTGFHFAGHPRWSDRPMWSDREVRRDQLETLRPSAGPIGRPPRATDLVVVAIQRAIETGKITWKELPTVKDAVLESLVGGSRHTRRQARRIVLDSHKKQGDVEK
jgi:hypothetical protein